LNLKNINNMKEYKVVNGTSYGVRTNENIIRVLENCRKNKTRITLDYGNVNTGDSWGDLYDITGRISRSDGINKIPILLFNSRSIGSQPITDDCIIGIKESNGGKVLYSFKY
jgi:hypothetical protein